MTSDLATIPPCPEGLTDQQWRVARDIADGVSPAEAAEREGVKLLTVLEWRYHPAFITWLRKAKEAKVALASAQLVSLATDAINTLRLSMKGDNPKVALDAAKEVLRLVGVGPEFTRDGDIERQRENALAAVRWVADQLQDENAREAVLALVGGR